MTWILDDDPSDDTWSRLQLREDGGRRLLWPRAGPAHPDARWVVTRFEQSGGVRRDAGSDELTVAEAVTLAPEHAQVVLEQTRAALVNMGEDDVRGRELAAELDEALRELGREDTQPTPDGRHPRRDDGPLAPSDYLRSRPR